MVGLRQLWLPLCWQPREMVKAAVARGLRTTWRSRTASQSARKKSRTSKFEIRLKSDHFSEPNIQGAIRLVKAVRLKEPRAFNDES